MYFGPMGCQTGFYFLFDGKQLTLAQAVALVQRVFAQGAVFEGEMPGKSAKECGNYRNLDVELAKTCCAFYTEIISGWNQWRNWPIPRRKAGNFCENRQKQRLSLLTTGKTLLYLISRFEWVSKRRLVRPPPTASP